MAIEDSMAEFFNWVVDGITINEKIGDWSVSNLNSPLMMDLFYSEDSNSAIYGFSVRVERNTVLFYNYHREASKGTGTKSLNQLECAFTVLAIKRKQKVAVIFDTFGQKDTEAWLIKNKYNLNADEENKGATVGKLYQKFFHP